MAIRPVFCAGHSSLPNVIVNDIDFEWVAGREFESKQECIASLHQSAGEDKTLLEISTYSNNPLGVSLSAFNLMIHGASGRPLFPVESAYQSSKVFENGGPFTDLLSADAYSAKADPRLRNAGQVTGFHFNGKAFPSNPQKLFFSWLYLNALCQQQEVAEALLQFDGFTDIAFNPKTGVNCQAHAAALYVSLRATDQLTNALSSPHELAAILNAMEGDLF